MEPKTWLEYLGMAFKSRTVWVTVLLVATNTIVDLPVSDSLKDLLNGVLGLLAIYFRVNPKQ